MSERYRIYSEELKEHLTLTVNSSWDMSAYTDDGVLYSSPELMAVRMAGAKVPRSVHIAKKIFGGTIDSVLPVRRRK